MRHYKAKVALLGALSWLVTALIMAVPVSAAGTIGGRPALPRKDEPRSQSIFIHTLKQGSMVNDKLVVSNNSTEDQAIVLYAVDAIPSNTGAFTCKQKAEAITDAGKWLTLAQHRLELKPGASSILDFTITAPQKADVGEHNACIVLEGGDDSGEVSGNLRIRTRSAIRVALTIPGTLHREVEIEKYNVRVDNYRQQYTVKLSNSGNVSSDTDVSVSLKSIFGETIYRNAGQYPILPGNRMELSFENEKSPFFGGWYTADASISYDKNATKWGTQSVATLKSIQAKSQVIFIMPQPLAMIILLAGFAFIVWGGAYVIVHRRRERHIADTWRLYTVKDGDTLERLAEATSTDWKRIAKVNAIKPPYTLRSGQALQIPPKAKAAKKTSLKD